MLILGLGHKARHGKDSAALAIKRAFPELDIRLAAFADPLREEVNEAARAAWTLHSNLYHQFQGDPIRPYDGREALHLLCLLHGVEFDKNAVPDADYPDGKQRKLLQWWGTEYRRAEDPDYWANKGLETIKKAEQENADAIIFRDMRFHNEYDMLGELGGWRIKISRLGYVSDVPPHISESELDDRPFDIQLGVRDGSLFLLQDLSILTFKRLIGL